MIINVNTSNVINWKATGFDKIADNVANILKTKMSEVPYMRDMGISPGYIDMPIKDIKGQLMNDAINAIKDYEPRVKVNNICIDDTDPEGNISIKVVIEI